MTKHSRDLAWRYDLTPADEGGYLVTFPDWPPNMTEGDTKEEAATNAADLLETMVSAALANEEDLPPPAGKRDTPVAFLSPMSAAKVHLRAALREARISKAELARRLGQTPQQTGRLFDLRHESRMDQLEAAFKALGKVMIVNMRDAAE